MIVRSQILRDKKISLFHDHLHALVAHLYNSDGALRDTGGDGSRAVVGNSCTRQFSVEFDCQSILLFFFEKINNMKSYEHITVI